MKRGRPRGSKSTNRALVAIPNSPVLNVPESAALLRVSETLIWKEIKRGNLKPFRLGDRVLFNRAYLESLAE